MPIHVASVDALHEQPRLVLTSMVVPLPPPAPIEWLSGVTENGQFVEAVTPAWATVAVWPAIVSDAVRAPPTLLATVKLTVPGPLPLAPAVIVSHGAPLAAVHAHAGAVATVTGVPAPPAAVADWADGAIVNVQAVAAPSWDTAIALPAIVTEPARATPELAATATVAVPLPVRALPEVTVIHGALLTEVHGHPSVVDTAKGPPGPPEAPMVKLVGVMPKAHALALSCSISKV